MEPLGAPEEPVELPAKVGQAAVSGVFISIEGASVRASGHSILEDITLQIEPGTHVAIVGGSGAGKSSLTGLLLGWHRPATGVVAIDGEELTGVRLQALRRETAWIEPQVRLWNRTLLDNLLYGGLLYGGGTAGSRSVGEAIEESDLLGVIEKLPGGLNALLGEGGTLLSGGEGQRVRIGRAWMRDQVRLAILDEPGRGLEREKRRSLIARARERWSQATLLCITHDVSDTRDFPRVIVLDKGRIVEDGSPAGLAHQADSRYRALLDAEITAQRIWRSSIWRRLHIQDGSLVDESGRVHAVR